MGINASKVGGSKFKKDLLTPGSYPGRLVQVIDCGLQPQQEYKGEAKPPAEEIIFTYEFSDEFMQDEDGQEMKDKPRWLSERMALRSLRAENAKSTARYNTFDPTGIHGGDFGKCIGLPVMITVINNPGKGKNAGKVFENIENVSAMREKDAAKCPPLVNEPRIFDLSSPDLEVFKSLPTYIQDRIKTNLNFKGSALEGLLGNEPTSSPNKETSTENDENPY